MSGAVEHETGRVKALRAALLGTASHDCLVIGQVYAKRSGEPGWQFIVTAPAALEEAGTFSAASFEALGQNEKARLP